MRNPKGFKRLVLMSLLAILILTMLPLNTIGEPVQEVSPMREHSTVSIRVNGVAIRKIDEERKKMSLTMDLTLGLGEKQKELIPIKLVEGTITIDGVSHSVIEAEGAVLFERRVIILRLSCEGSMSLVLKIKYFWMGGGLYAVRGGGVSSGGDHRMLILFRGTARVT